MPYRKPAQTDDLTQQEKDMLVILSNGHGTAEVATSFRVAPSTAHARLHRIYEKLGASNVTEAVATALRQGLIR